MKNKPRISTRRHVEKFVGRVFKLQPLPEEQFGLTGPDSTSSLDRIKSPMRGTIVPVDLSDELNIGSDDQGLTNRCTGFTARKFGEAIAKKIDAQSNLKFSPNYTYVKATGDYSKDQGTGMRDIAMAAVTHGFIPSSYWPDRILSTTPPGNLVGNPDLPTFKIPSVERITSVRDLISTLSVERLPVMIGSRMFQRGADKACKTGWFPESTKGDSWTGNHAELIVGWMSVGDKVWFKKVGSWGNSVGILGSFWIPEDYIHTGVVMDMWTAGKEIL